MKTFELTQRKQVAEYVSNIEQDASKMNMTCVILIAREAIAQVVDVTYALFSDYFDAEQYMNSITAEKRAQDSKALTRGEKALAWVVYLGGKMFTNIRYAESSSADFGFVD